MADDKQKTTGEADGPVPAMPPDVAPGGDVAEPAGGPRPESGDEERFPRPRPDGEPASMVKLRELIEAKLQEILEGYTVDPRGSYVFGLESARVFVVPAWLPDERTVVRVFAITNLDVPVTAQLTSYLLEKNLEFVLGSFALHADEGAVWFNHNLLGEFMVPDELEATLAAVAQTANELDDEIKTRFGGRLFAEAPSDTISPPHAPGYL